MKQKYIEGTNKQYSIREDGVVIRNYRISRKDKQPIYKEVIKLPTLYKGRLQLSLDTSIYRIRLNISILVYTSFTNDTVSKTEKVINIDNDEHNCSINNLKKVNTNVFVNPELGIAMNNEQINKRAYKLAKDKPAYKKYQRKYQRDLARERVKTIDKYYVANKLNISIQELPDDFYEFYKAQLKLKRLIKTKRNGKD